MVASILGMAGRALAKKYLSKKAGSTFLKRKKTLTSSTKKNDKEKSTFLSRASNLSGMPNVISRYPMIGKLNKKKKNQ